MSEFSNLIADWKKAKTIKYVRWNTCIDDEVCEVCRERAGKKFLLDEVEQLIPAHEGCRCWIGPIVDEDLVHKRREDILSGLFGDD